MELDLEKHGERVEYASLHGMYKFLFFVFGIQLTPYKAHHEWMNRVVDSPGLKYRCSVQLGFYFLSKYVLELVLDTRWRCAGWVAGA